jgi:small subunit ribosomal protein S19e
MPKGIQEDQNMATIYDVDTNELIEKAAEKLKSISEIKAPSWAPFVKTGVHKERAPAQENWWELRTAAILRTIYRLGPIGVSKLRIKYGGNKNRGVKPDKFYRASGSIIRKILQQLDKAGLTKFGEVGKNKVHKGRIITPKGKSLLDKPVRKEDLI